MSIPTYKLTRDQQEKTKKIFNALDADKSGYIEVRELGSVISTLGTMGIAIDKKNLEIVVNKFDKSGNKRLNADQFSQMLVYLLDMKAKALADINTTTSDISKITVTTGGSKPTSVTTTSRASPPTSPKASTLSKSVTPPSPLRSGSSRSAPSSPTPTLRQTSTPAAARRSVEPTNTRSTTTTTTTSSTRATPTTTTTTVTTKTIVRAKKAPLRRIKDAFKNYHRQINTILSKDKDHPPVSVVVSEKEHPHSSSSSSSSKAHSSSGSQFVDSSFPANNSVLPRHAVPGVVAWKRPHEMCENPRLFVDGTEEGDVVQGSLGDCWFAGALAVLATSGNDFIEHIFVKADVRKGEYKCKFYKDFEWVTVTVDDRLPCNANGRPYFASCVDPNEWWVPILEKAYAKLHGSYEAIESGNLTDALKDMTGEAVEIIRIEEYKDKSQLWKTLLHYLEESFLMGCAIENSSAAAEQENEYPLSYKSNIIDCQEVKGNKLMRIRNPWGKGEWKGPWSDGSREWTPALKKHFDYEFGNDGTFFMRFEDFIKFYNRIHVLCLLTDDQGEVWKKAVVKGRWKGETAGGCSNNPTWPFNPQYAITSSHANNKIFIGLSQPDLRYKYKQSPAKHGHKYEAIGVFVLKTNGAATKVGPYSEIEREGAPSFVMQRDSSFDFVAQKDKTYILVPCTFKPKVEQSFEMLIYSQRPIKIQELQGTPRTK